MAQAAALGLGREVALVLTLSKAEGIGSTTALALVALVVALAAALGLDGEVALVSTLSTEEGIGLTAPAMVQGAEAMRHLVQVGPDG